jgi:Na+/melibiose symporter-like transporter
LAGRDQSHRQRFSLARLIGYGSLGLPLAALNLPLFVYLPTFYADELGVPLATVGLILLAARLLDVISDPLFGELSDRTQSRLGRRIPWLLGSAPILLIASFMLFVPPDGAGALHLMIWSVAAYLGWTAMILSYSAIGAEITGDYHERTRLTTAREGFVVCGIMLAAAIPILMGAKPGEGAVLEAIYWSMALSLPILLMVMLVSLPAHRQTNEQEIGFIDGLRIAFRNRPFTRLISAYFLNGIANGLPATLFLLFAEHRLGAPEWSGTFLLAYFGFGILAVPVWLRISMFFGKHRTWAASMVWACLNFALVLTLGEGDVTAFIVICCLSGMSLGADLALPASMQADVIDLDRLESGRERTGLFFGLWGMATKMALALAVGIAFPVLGMIGFTPDGVNSEEALMGLALLYGGIPVLIKAGSITIIWHFELDEAAQRQLRARIEANQ